jgi:hypothetical protein
MKFVATIKGCGQVGENSYQDYAVSKVFEYSQPLNDVMTWLVSQGYKNPNITDVTLSHLHEE